MALITVLARLPSQEAVVLVPIFLSISRSAISAIRQDENVGRNMDRINAIADVSSPLSKKKQLSTGKIENPYVLETVPISGLFFSLIGLVYTIPRTYVKAHKIVNSRFPIISNTQARAILVSAKFHFN